MDLNRLTLTRYGIMLYNRYDIIIGKSLEAYGEYSQEEMDFLEPYIPQGGVCLDIGANIGTHTLFFSKAVGNAGQVIACEPQHTVFMALCGNIALNDLLNVRALNIALTDKNGVVYVPKVNYLKDGNFGREGITVEPKSDAYPVQGATLDSMSFPKLDQIKIDVEGHEPEVLLGGLKTLEKHKPFIYAEYKPECHTKNLRQILESANYDIYLHRISYYNQNNFKNSLNVFESEWFETNIFCVHKSNPITVPLPKLSESRVERKHRRKNK
jgi:FkbM family methyltransferase